MNKNLLNKNLVLFFLLFISFFYSSVINAQETAQTGLPKLKFDSNVEVSPDKNVERKIIIKYKLNNNEAYFVGGISIIVEFSKILEDNSTDKIFRKVLKKDVSLYQNSYINETTDIDIPENINTGEYFIKILAYNKTGIPIDEVSKLLGTINGKNEYLETSWKDSKLVKDGNYVEAKSGPTYDIDENPVVVIKIKNPQEYTISAFPRVSIYKRTDFDDANLVSSSNYFDQKIEFPAGFTKITKISLKNPAEAESYNVFVQFLDDNTNQAVSGLQEFRFVVKGESAKILSIDFNNSKKEIKNLIIGSADDSVISKASLKTEVALKKNPQKILFTKTENITDLGSKSKEIVFKFENQEFEKADITIKTTLYGSKEKILDQTLQDFELTQNLNKTTSETKNTNTNLGDVIFYLFFIIIIIVLVFAIMYINGFRFGQFSIFIFAILILANLDIKNVYAESSCEMFGDQDYCSSIGAPQIQDPYMTSGEEYNGTTQSLGAQIQASVHATAYKYSCSNASIAKNVVMDCQGALQKVNEWEDEDSKYIVCQCATSGKGIITTQVQNTLESEQCYRCNNSMSNQIVVNCQGAISTAIQPSIQPQIIPNTNWWPSSTTVTTTETPVPTEIPATPTPTYIPTALPTKKPGQSRLIDLPAGGNQVWRCLKSEYYSGDIKPLNMTDHRLKVKGSGFTQGAKTYIVGCITTDNDIVCTSGDNDTDSALGFGSNNYTKITTNTTSPFPYFFAYDKNSATISKDGYLEAIVFSASTSTTTHFFYGVTINETISDTAKTLQYSTLTFDSDTSKCTAVRWDPKGIIYDINSYKPIPNVKLELLNDKKERVILPGITNPILTKNDGIFNFFVGKGKYYLKITPPINYQIPIGNKEEIEIEEDGINLIELSIPLIHK